MQPPPKEIAVVGAGPAGLVFARAHRGAGRRITVYEQAPEPRRGGGGLLLHGNGLRVLSALGLLEAIGPHIVPIRRLELHMSERPTPFVRDLSGLPPPHDQAAVILRSKLLDVLLDAARAAGISVRYGHRLARIERSRDTLSLGFEHTRQTHTVDCLVGADGVHSMVRRSLGLPERVVPVGQAYLRGVAAVETEAGAAHEYGLADGRRFGLAPLPGGRTYFYCTAPFGRWEHVRRSERAAWIESWAPAGPVVRRVLEAIEHWDAVHYDEIREVRCRKWCDPPAFLVGDAAHAMTPNLGQGANSAMMDAYVLARLLGEAFLQADGSVARRYLEIRRPFVERLQRASRQVGAWFSSASPLRRRLLRAALAAGERHPSWGRRDRLLSVGYNPRELPLFQDERRA
ncbi:MAG: FAD-dependent monooxygenase [Deltaproteobacteria bacterium]|nr:MAG: FAD-dependent monooxygenase [Deltaproteobacteria bacterium]